MCSNYIQLYNLIHIYHSLCTIKPEPIYIRYEQNITYKWLIGGRACVLSVCRCVCVCIMQMCVNA